MPTLTLELSDIDYYILRKEAARLNQSIQRLIMEGLAEKFTLPLANYQTTDQILKTAGLLSELSPPLQQRARLATMTLPEIIQLMTSVQGQSLTDILLEQRATKL